MDISLPEPIMPRDSLLVPISAENIGIKAVKKLLVELAGLTKDFTDGSDFNRHAEQLARLALSDSQGQMYGAPSTSSLAGDGIPIEVALSLSQHGIRGYGCNFDPAAYAKSFAEKIRIADKTAQIFLTKIASPDNPALVTHQRLVELLFPPVVKKEDRNRFALWLGLLRVSNGLEILKLFYNLRPKGQHKEAKIKTLETALKLVCPSVDNLVLEGFRYTFPAQPEAQCLALERIPGGSNRVKIYYRCMGPVSWAELLGSVIAFGFDALAVSLEKLISIISPLHTGCTERSVLLYIAFQEDGSPSGLNIYLVLGSLVKSDVAAFNVIRKVGDSLDIDMNPYNTLMHKLQIGRLSESRLHHHTILGIGDSGHDLRMNIYLKPTWAMLVGKEPAYYQ